MHSSEFYRQHYADMADGGSHHRFIATNQKGNGFFGRLVRGSLLPIIKSVLPYIKNVALDGVGGLVDELKEGKTLTEASSNQLKRTSDTVLSDMAKKMRRQTGSGLRKRRKRRRVVRRRTKRRTTARPTGLFKT